MGELLGLDPGLELTVLALKRLVGGKVELDLLQLDLAELIGPLRRFLLGALQLRLEQGKKLPVLLVLPHLALDLAFEILDPLILGQACNLAVLESRPICILLLLETVDGLLQP